MKNKKTLFILLGVGLIIACSIFYLIRKVQQTEQRKAFYGSIPHFQFPDIEGNLINESSLQAGKPVLFVFFNPGCDLCREELMQIHLHRDSLKHSQIVFFSPLPANMTRQFLSEIHFEPSGNMLFLIDEQEELAHKINVKISPATYIYNRNGQLVKHFEGPVKIETLIKYLSEN